jgi:hypothetical protein
VHDAEHAIRDLRGNATIRRYDDRYHVTARRRRSCAICPTTSAERSDRCAT